MSESLILLPGILGTELHIADGPPSAMNKIWVGPATILDVGFPALAYRPPSGLTLREGAIMANHATIMRWLTVLYMTTPDPESPGDRRFARPRAMPYDWRPDTRTIAAGVETSIRSVITDDGTSRVSLVCHSYGGLVARAVYRRMSEVGDEHLIRRIVTLGTPHLGATSSVATLLDEDEFTAQVGRITWAGNLLLGPRILGRPQLVEVETILRTSSRWPALYDLYPSPIQPDPPPGIDAMYDASRYDDRYGVQQSELDRARDEWWPWISDVQHQPGPGTLIVVAGTGYRTQRGVTGVIAPRPGGKTITADWVTGGDERVTAESATWSGQPLITYRLGTDHGGLIVDTRALRAVSAALTEELPDEVTSGRLNPRPGRVPVPRPPQVAGGPGANYPPGSVVGQYVDDC